MTSVFQLNKNGILVAGTLFANAEKENHEQEEAEAKGSSFQKAWKLVLAQRRPPSLLDMVAPTRIRNKCVCKTSQNAVCD